VSRTELIELKPEELHRFWPFLLRGMLDVKHDMQPNWIPEDLYAALKQAQVNCVMARRDERMLGFLVYSKQQRIFNYEPELFVWCAWNIPMREWLPDDDMAAVVARVWAYIANIAKTVYGTSEITWVTRPRRAKAFERKFGWPASWVTITAKV
jgi:hypothetical protein